MPEDLDKANHSFVVALSARGDISVIEDEILTRLNTKVLSRDGSLTTFQLGSRFAFRMWGMFGPGASSFPMKVTLQNDLSGSQAIVTVSKDVGWYLFQVPAVDTLFDNHARQIEKEVRRAVAGHS